MITITVLVTHYEDIESLIRCFSSLVFQTRMPDEILIVDDCSRDYDISLLPLNYFPLNVRFVSTLHNSGGPALPRNIGIDLITTTHVVFLDCDDILSPFVIENYHKEWSSSSNTLLYGHAYYWNEAYVSFLKDRPYLVDLSYSKLLRRGNYLVLSGIGGNIDIFKNNKFDLHQRWEDFDLWLKLSKLGYTFKYIGMSTFYENKEISRSSSSRSRRKGLFGLLSKNFDFQFLLNLGIWPLKNLF